MRHFAKNAGCEPGRIPSRPKLTLRGKLESAKRCGTERAFLPFFERRSGSLKFGAETTRVWRHKLLHRKDLRSGSSTVANRECCLRLCTSEQRKMAESLRKNCHWLPLCVRERRGIQSPQLAQGVA